MHKSVENGYKKRRFRHNGFGDEVDMKPRVEVLEESEVREIYEASLEILENVGVVIFHEKALKMLEEHGATVNYETKIARFPQNLVKDSLKKTPSSISFYDTKGKNVYKLEGDEVHYTPGAAAVKILDSETLDARSPKVDDLVKLVKLTDMLKNIHFQSTALVPSDVPNPLVDRYRVYILLKYSRKPIVTGTFTFDGTRDIINLFAAAAEGMDIRKKPVGTLVCCPTSPLKWSELQLQSLIECCKHNVPVIVVPAPALGLTAPGAMAATLAQHTAEVLSGVVIAQLVKPASPVIFGGSANVADLRYGTTLLGSMETAMLFTSLAQIAKYLNLPVHAFAGVVDSKVVDFQAGQESGVGLLMGALAGVNLMHGPGMVELESCQSLEKLVLDNEICGMALRFKRGFEVNKETLALDIISEVGAGGEYIKNFKALKFLRKNVDKTYYLPSDVVSRETRMEWKAKGAKNAFEKAKEHVKKLLEEYEGPVLSSEALGKMKAILKAAAERNSVSLPSQE
ncbi:hypothetical protein DRO34_00250 [Candidatus Bathyarchaeota archaeon]|nr:MAG: hypothetical protein DRO34_00250 [Candidatus Bathyarchaeota archaeon]